MIEPHIDTERMADHFVKYHLKGPWPFHPVIHHISAPDHGFPHDHPWSFRSVILHGWYREEIFRTDEEMQRLYTHRMLLDHPPYRSWSQYHRKGHSFQVAAGHIHRITDVSEGGCWTLIIPGEPERKSGFYDFREDGTYHRFWDGDWSKMT